MLNPRNRIPLALIFVGLQIWLFSLGNLGDHEFPFPIPTLAIIFTLAYALVAKSYPFSFMVGLLSVFSYPLGVAAYYYNTSRRIVLPPLDDAFLVFTGLAIGVGGLGLLAVKASKLLRNGIK